jgi:hypothetical protein
MDSFWLPIYPEAARDRKWQRKSNTTPPPLALRASAINLGSEQLDFRFQEIILDTVRDTHIIDLGQGVQYKWN